MAGNNRFTIDFYRQLAADAGNAFFSPYSISCALAMTVAGASNETEREIRKALHFTLRDSLLHRNFNALGASVISDTSVTLSIVNQAWGRCP